MIAARYVFYSIIPPLFLAPSFCLLSPLALLSNPLLLTLPCKHSSSQRALKKRPVSLLRPDGFLLLLYTALASVKTRLKGEPRRPSSPCQRAALNCSSEQRPVCLIFIARLPSLRPPAKREEVACECPPPVWSPPPPPPVGRSVGRSVPTSGARRLCRREKRPTSGPRDTGQTEPYRDCSSREDERRTRVACFYNCVSARAGWGAGLFWVQCNVLRGHSWRI
jgi:hypothetical protein